MYQRITKTPNVPIKRGGCCGITTIELIVGMSLLALLFSTILPMLRWADWQKKESQRRTIATQVASNLLEELTSQKYAGLAKAIAEQSDVPEEYREILPDASLEVDLTPTEEPPAGQKMTVTLRWTNRAGQSARPVRLTSYVYPNGGNQP